MSNAVRQALLSCSAKTPPPRRRAGRARAAGFGGLLALLPVAAGAQTLTLEVGTGGLSAQIVQLVLLLTVLSIAPSVLIMMTSFVRIVVVLSLLRTAIGVQASPPNPVIISLALFLTAFVMAPTFNEAWKAGVQPFMAEEMPIEAAFPKAIAPVKNFMLSQTREKDLELFFSLAKVEPTTLEATPLHIATPAFMISELRRAFEIGFLIFIPFLIIDMAISAILMAMGMMMLPPIVISLPFKLIFFVLIDGWRLLAGSLVQSFGT
jgi:flagellar biosynthetic protein FliP